MGGGEIVLIVFVALLFFGADAIPGIAKTFGKAMREFQKATNEIKREINESGGLGDDLHDIRSTIQNVKSDIQEGIRKHTSDIQDEVKKHTEGINDDIKEVNNNLNKSNESSASHNEANSDYSI